MKRKRSVVTSRRPAARSLAPPLPARPVTPGRRRRLAPRRAARCASGARPSRQLGRLRRARSTCPSTSPPTGPAASGSPIRSSSPRAAAATGSSSWPRRVAPPAAIVTRGTTLRAHGRRRAAADGGDARRPRERDRLAEPRDRARARDVRRALGRRRMCPSCSRSAPTTRRASRRSLARRTRSPGVAGLELHLGCRGCAPGAAADAADPVARPGRGRGGRRGGPRRDEPAGHREAGRDRAGRRGGRRGRGGGGCRRDQRDRRACPPLAIDRGGRRPALGAGGRSPLRVRR